jgi:hypothetical protein
MKNLFLSKIGKRTKNEKMKKSLKMFKMSQKQKLISKTSQKSKI